MRKNAKQYNLTPPARVWDLTTPGILNDITDRLQPNRGNIKNNSALLVTIKIINMDKFCLVAIMLFAMQRDMVDYSITDVIGAIDRARGIIPRTDYLELVFSDALSEHDIYNVSFGVYDKYFDNRQFVERVLPF